MELNEIRNSRMDHRDFFGGVLRLVDALAFQVLYLVLGLGGGAVIRSKKILRHARGQPCLLALPGCNCDPETTR